MIFTLISLFFWLMAITVAITVHEFSHALAADKLGDPTPRSMGRLSLNPLDHYDRIGTTMLLVTSFARALGFPIIPFGWAKPVVFDPYNLKTPRRDGAFIALAGPASNLLLAALLSVIIRLLPTTSYLLPAIATPLIMINIVLALFNLVPVHPLDGGKILIGFLPKDLAYEAEAVLSRYGTLILLFLILPVNGTSPIFSLLEPAINFFLRLFLP